MIPSPWLFLSSVRTPADPHSLCLPFLGTIWPPFAETGFNSKDIFIPLISGEKLSRLNSCSHLLSFCVCASLASASVSWRGVRAGCWSVPRCGGSLTGPPCVFLPGRRSTRKRTASSWRMEDTSIMPAVPISGSTVSNQSLPASSCLICSEIS